MTTRRDFLLIGFAALAFCLSQARAVPMDPEVESFLTLSAELTGFPKESLDRQLAQRYLASLKDVEPADREERHNRIAEMWYTGLRGTTTGSERMAFKTSLAWESLRFTRPPSYCGNDWGTS